MEIINTSMGIAMLDNQLSILSNVQRRRILLALLRENPQDVRTVTVDALDSNGEEQGRAITMKHVHLPKLEDHECINWNREERNVTKGSQFDEIKPLLTVLKEFQGEISAQKSFD